MDLWDPKYPMHTTIDIATEYANTFVYFPFPYEQYTIAMKEDV